jgi:hypothetical protein
MILVPTSGSHCFKSDKSSSFGSLDEKWNSAVFPSSSTDSDSDSKREFNFRSRFAH